MMGIPAGMAGIDFIQSRAMQGDPTSRAVINAAGGITGLAASAALAAKLSGGNPIAAGLAGLAGYAAGGYGSDRAMDEMGMAPVEEAAPMQAQSQVQAPPPPQFDKETMLRAQLAQMQKQKQVQQQQAMSYLNQQMGMG
jgi:hypothetical protein